MGIDVGTLVKKYVYDEDRVGYLYCDSLQRGEEYSEDYQRKLDVCLGMVVEAISNIVGDADEKEVIVAWVHMCRYHHKLGAITETGEHPDNLWEVGQL